MKEREDRIGQSMDWFDQCTDHDLTVSRSVEITDECVHLPLFESIVVDYAQSTTGILVRIGYVGESDEDVTMTMVTQPFPLDRLDEVPQVAAFAEQCGLSSEELVLLVMQEAPRIDREKLIADFRMYSLAPDSHFEDFLRKAGLKPEQLLA